MALSLSSQCLGFLAFLAHTAHTNQGARNPLKSIKTSHFLRSDKLFPSSSDRDHASMLECKQRGEPPLPLINFPTRAHFSPSTHTPNDHRSRRQQNSSRRPHSRRPRVPRPATGSPPIALAPCLRFYRTVGSAASCPPSRTARHQFRQKALPALEIASAAI